MVKERKLRIRDDLLETVQNIAKEENKPIDEVLLEMAEEFTASI